MRFKLHLTKYDNLAENPAVTTRSVELAQLPSIGQHLVVARQPYYVAAAYLDIDQGDGIAGHVFAKLTSVPPDQAALIGVEASSAGYPSLIHFEGNTVGDLMAFFAEYPRDMNVRFVDGQILVAKPKGDDLILRLDDKDEDA